MLTRANVLLLISAILLGLGAASSFAAYQAVNGDGSPVRDFAVNLGWPGILILAPVAVIVWFGWKANLD
ncbi:MAG: hypothetical protein IH997_13995 [Proteobacteria bacterium]|nr:hypothetical protein [Pseudomonadota bacterium]